MEDVYKRQNIPSILISNFTWVEIYKEHLSREVCNEYIAVSYTHLFGATQSSCAFINGVIFGLSVIYDGTLGVIVGFPYIDNLGV